MDLWDVATNFLVSNITGKNYRITGQFSPDNIFFFRHLNKTESALYLNFKPTSQQLAFLAKIQNHTNKKSGMEILLRSYLLKKIQLFETVI